MAYQAVGRKLIQMGLDFTGKQIAKKTAQNAVRKTAKMKARKDQNQTLDQKHFTIQFTNTYNIMIFGGIGQLMAHRMKAKKPRRKTNTVSSNTGSGGIANSVASDALNLAAQKPKPTKVLGGIGSAMGGMAAKAGK